MAACDAWLTRATGTDLERHQIQRLRHETRRRILTLTAVERLTPNMARLTFAAPDLQDFVSASHDDHIKLFFPAPAGSDPVAKPVARDFTPRRCDTKTGALTIDFALHEAGPATGWAASARVGATLEIGGPRGSSVTPDDFDWYLLIGDETALPAIGRRVEELRAGAPVTTCVVVASEADAQQFETRAIWSPIWVTRTSRAHDAATLCAALSTFQPPPGDGFVWIAAEASVARAMRAYMLEERGHPRAWIKAAGYWKQGQAETHERIED